MSEEPKYIKIKTPLELDRIILGSFGASRGVNILAATEHPEALADLIDALEYAVELGLITRSEAEKFLRPFLRKSTAKFLKKKSDLLGKYQLWIGVPDQVLAEILKQRLRTDFKSVYKKILGIENGDSQDQV